MSEAGFLRDSHLAASLRHCVSLCMEAGTASYNEPCWYVTPWPYQGPLALAPVDGAGSWHTDGWIGAVQPTSRLVRDGEAGRAGAEIPALRDSDLRGRPAEECRPIEGGVLGFRASLQLPPGISITFMWLVKNEMC